MKNKLYNFLGKHYILVKILTVSGFVWLWLTPATNKIMTSASLAFTLVPFSALVFLIFETHYRDRAKALQFLADQQDSSSPKWDGYVRSSRDIEPRLQLLRNRIAQDQAEINNIEQLIKS